MTEKGKDLLWSLIGLNILVTVIAIVLHFVGVEEVWIKLFAWYGLTVFILIAAGIQKLFYE